MDQWLLRSGILDIDRFAAMTWASGWHANYREMALRFDPSRPQLVIAGNSRAENVWSSYVDPVVRAAALPHQVANLGIGGGSAPLAWLAMHDMTPFTRRWPANSKLVYLLTASDLSNVPVNQIASFPAGREFLSQYYSADELERLASEIPLNQLTDPLLRRLYPLSGIIQYVIKISRLTPEWFVNLQRLRFQEVVLIDRNFSNMAAPPPTECVSKLAAFHPGAVWAFDSMAEHFGKDLIVIVAPIRAAEAACEAGQLATVLAHVRDVRSRTGLRLIEDPATVMDLPDSVWDKDPTHLKTDLGRAIAAKAIVELIR
jgi:hypothetical protein